MCRILHAPVRISTPRFTLGHPRVDGYAEAVSVAIGEVARRGAARRIMGTQQDGPSHEDHGGEPVTVTEDFISDVLIKRMEP